MGDIANREEFLNAVEDVPTEEFPLKCIGKSVKIAPASVIDMHKCLADMHYLRENPDDAEARAAYEASWVVACMVDPEITSEDARKLMNSRSTDIRRLLNRCYAISNFGPEDEQEAMEIAEELDTAEEVPGTAPLD